MNNLPTNTIIEKIKKNAIRKTSGTAFTDEIKNNYDVRIHIGSKTAKKELAYIYFFHPTFRKYRNVIIAPIDNRLYFLPTNELDGQDMYRIVNKSKKATPVVQVSGQNCELIKKYAGLYSLTLIGTRNDEIYYLELDKK